MANNEYFIGEEGSLVPELPYSLVLSLSRMVNFPTLLQECEDGHYGFRVVRGKEYVEPPQPFSLSIETQQRLNSVPSFRREVIPGSILTPKMSEISVMRDAVPPYFKAILSRQNDMLQEVHRWCKSAD